MKTFYGLAALFLSAPLAGVSFAESFVRPVVSSVITSENAYDEEVGYGFAVGKSFGGKGAHEVSVEFQTAKWEYDTNTPPLLFAGGSIRGDGSRQSYLINYRFLTGNQDSKYRFYFGPYVGMTNTRGDYFWSPSGIYAKGYSSDWGVTMGGALGLQWAISKRLALDVGARGLWTDGVDATINLLENPANPMDFHFESISTAGLYLGLRYSF